MGLDRSTFASRAAQARKMLAACELCEHRCRVDRYRGPAGTCRLGATSHVYRHYLSYAEELELLPSYMVYFAGCNLRCSSCIQIPACLDANHGTAVAADPLVQMAKQAAAQGARTINLVGGEPSLHVHTILEMAATGDTPLPMVLNSNMYMSPAVLDWLDGIVNLYLADFKFGNDACAARIAGAPNYTNVVTRNLQRAAGQGKLLVRHLLLPGHVNCCLKPVVQWMARQLPAVPLHVMYSYTQGWRCDSEGELNRLVSSEEIAAAEGWMKTTGVRQYEPAKA